MILSAGLSPAWQHTLVFDTLRVGQVNRAREAHWCASGKVINAARAVRRLAAHDGGALRGLALTVLGGSTGDATRAALAAEGLDTAIVRTQAATRVCTTVIGRTEGSVTELVEEAGALTPEELDAFRARFRTEAASAKAVVLTGSLPTGTPPDFFRTLIEGIAAPVVLDVRGPELLAVLPLKPFLVKPNREELARTVGHPIDGETALRAAMHEVARQGAAWVVVSQGGDAVWALGAWPVLPDPTARRGDGEPHRLRRLPGGRHRVRNGPGPSTPRGDLSGDRRRGGQRRQPPPRAHRLRVCAAPPGPHRAGDVLRLLLYVHGRGRPGG